MNGQFLLALSGQAWAVAAVILGAAVYLALQAWRALFRGKRCGGCGPVSCSPPAAGFESRTPAGEKSFLPLESFSKLAQRHRQERERRESSP